MTVMYKLLEPFPMRLYQHMGFHIPLCRRMHQSEVLLTQIKSNDVKNEKAMKWLSNLSPENRKRKEYVEYLIDELKEKYSELSEIEISPMDMKIMIKDCKDYYSVKSHLLYKKAARLDKARKEKNMNIKKEEAVLKRMSEDKLNPDEIGWFEYTKENPYQISRHHKHQQLRPHTFDAVPVVFDMDYEETGREQKSISKQLQYCQYVNRSTSEPCHIHITSYKRNSVIAHECDVGLSYPEHSLHEEGFDKIFPLEKLVYITPIAPQLKNHIPGDIYIIGGYVTHESDVIAVKKAYRMGIRFGSVPFKRNGVTSQMIGGKRGYSLLLPAMIDLVLDVNLQQDWSMAIRNFVRKSHGNKRYYKVRDDD